MSESDQAALPQILPIFPLTGVLLLPRGRLPLNIFEPRYLAMTRDALGGLARALIARGEIDKARQALARVPKESANHAEITAARSALELAEQAQKAMGSAGKLKARLEQNADDHEARFELATALFGAGEREAAIDELLTLFKRDRKWDEEAARRQLVKFFEAMGHGDPLTVAARKRLSSILFA